MFRVCFATVKSFSMTSGNSFPRPFTHVIFDMDGVLLDTVPIYDEIMRSVTVRQGYEYTKELKNQLRGRNRIDCAELLVKHCEHSLTVDECLSNFNKRRARLLPFCKVMPGAEKLVRHLHHFGVPMAVGTSSSVESAAMKMNAQRDLFAMMDNVTCGCGDPNVLHGKPAPDIFLEAARKFDPPAKPAKCLVFEDALSGVEAAKAAGMQVVLVSDEKTSLQVAHQLRSLLDFKPEMFGFPPYECS